MMKTKTAFPLPNVKPIAITQNKPLWTLGMLALFAVLCTPIAADWALAGAEQEQTSYIDEAEENAYRAATKEPDPQKRMIKVFEFYQKYPNSRLMALPDFEIIKPIEEEYSAYYASVQEPDLAKRGEMLIGFLQRYPQSTFKESAEREYTIMLKAALESKKYEQVEVLAEKWLKIHPDSKETYAFLAEAAMNLKHYDKDADSLEALYAMQPTPSLAREIHSAYQKAENLPKQLEWADKLFKMPEFAADYMLRYDYVVSFLSRKDLSKAAEYAQLALKSVELVEQPDAKTKEQLRQVRRACHHVIASDLMEKNSFAEAIEAFKKAIAAEKHGEGYYKIGQCMENLKRIEEAMLYYAKAALMGDEFADKAKTRLELLYKALHNDTLIGIDKIYNKAKELP